MKEQRIIFKTARMAYGKGFSIPPPFTHGYIMNDRGKQIKQSDMPDPEDVEEALRNGTLKRIVSPTQSVLQKWFRDEHNVDITIALVDAGYGFYIHVNRSSTNAGQHFGDHPKYEMALEAALEKAFDYI